MTATSSDSTDAGSAPLKSFDQAFDEAVAASGEGGESGESGDEAGEGGSTEGGSETPPADTEEEGQGSEASEGTDEATSGTDEGSDEAGGKPSDAADLDAMLGVADSPKLKALLESIPKEHHPAVRQYFNGVLQPRFQAIAGQRKFIEAFRRDPAAAARGVLAQLGKSADASEDRAASASTSTAPTDASIVAGLVKGGFTEAQANALLPTIRTTAEAITKPHAEAIESMRVQEIARSVDEDLTAFEKAYPDFKELEPRMSSLMAQYPQGENISRREYLEGIRNLALGPRAAGEVVKKTIKKMTDNAKTAAATKAKAVPGANVRPGPPGKLPTFEESVAAAERGEVWGRGIHR